jgi:hypothetical protein
MHIELDPNAARSGACRFWIIVLTVTSPCCLFSLAHMPATLNPDVLYCLNSAIALYLTAYLPPHWSTIGAGIG